MITDEVKFNNLLVPNSLIQCGGWVHPVLFSATQIFMIVLLVEHNFRGKLV
jgi:hypothetical protein